MIDKKDYNNKTIILINLILFEVFITILSSLFVSLQVNRLWGASRALISRFSALVSSIVGLLSMFMLKEITRLADKEREAEINQILLEERKESIELLRTHRHDFLNHLQVISGLVQLNKIDNLKEYIKQITGELKSTAINDNIENPVLAALFLKKNTIAEQRGLKYKTIIKSQLKGINVSFNDLSRIVGNLIDNAIYAAYNDKEQHKEKYIEISVSEDKKIYQISVKNTGNPITSEIKEKIFERGFTTKGKDGNGLGLYIVKDLVNQNRGQIFMNSSDAGETIFTVTFPKETID